MIITTTMKKQLLQRWRWTRWRRWSASWERTATFCNKISSRRGKMIPGATLLMIVALQMKSANWWFQILKLRIFLKIGFQTTRRKRANELNKYEWHPSSAEGESHGVVTQSKVMTMMMTMMMTVMVAVLVMELWKKAKSFQLHWATIRPMTIDPQWMTLFRRLSPKRTISNISQSSLSSNSSSPRRWGSSSSTLNYMTPSIPGLKIISIVQRQPASEVDRTKPTKATKCLDVLLQVLIWYLIWSSSHLMACCDLKSVGSSSSPAKGARIAKPVVRQPVVPNSPR